VAGRVIPRIVRLPVTFVVAGADLVHAIAVEENFGVMGDV
jgi:hypothetical protein